MGLTSVQQESIASLLKTCIRNRFAKYNPEPAFIPFHTRLLGKERLALCAFIQSLNTNFGISIFEPVAKAIAQDHFSYAENRQKAGTQISTASQRVIQNIIDNLSSAAKSPDQDNELKLIREVCRQGEIRTVKPTMVDLKLVDKSGRIFLIDLRQPSPMLENSRASNELYWSGRQSPYMIILMPGFTLCLPFPTILMNPNLITGGQCEE